MVLNHGYIEPSVYVTGQGLSREQDYLARAGFVVLHTDYRGHAGSDPATPLSRETRLGYTRDTINAVQSLKREKAVDPDRVAMLGRSMGGAVTLNALVAKPGLVKAGVVFASVSSRFLDNFDRWTRRRATRGGGRVHRGSGRRPRSRASTAGCPRGGTSTGSPRRCCCTTAPPTTPARSPGRGPPSPCSARPGSARASTSTTASSTRSARSGPSRCDGPSRSSVASWAPDPGVRPTGGSMPSAPACSRRGPPGYRGGHHTQGEGMTGPHDELHDRRLDAVRAWTAFVEHGDGATSLVRPEILDSWQRSEAAISRDVTEAPLADESDTRAFWQDSPLQTAVERVEAELRRTAEDGDLVIAITDAETRILWTYGGRVMRRKAETVNFVAGGRWDDTSRRHQRARPGQPLERARRWCSAPSTSPRSCTTGSAGRRPCTTRSPASSSASSTSPRPGTAPTRSASPPPG